MTCHDSFRLLKNRHDGGWCSGWVDSCVLCAWLNAGNWARLEGQDNDALVEGGRWVGWMLLCAWGTCKNIIVSLIRCVEKRQLLSVKQHFLCFCWYVNVCLYSVTEINWFTRQRSLEAFSLNVTLVSQIIIY